jgi:5'-phosphate synthase pdxT subunit
MKKIGVLALQGAFIEHISCLRKLGADAFPVRLPHELEGIHGLIIPGGESTVIAKLMQSYNLTGIIRELVSGGLPVFGTCAGMILLSRKASQLNSGVIGAIDIEVTRNAFGRQIDSFETDIPIPSLGEKLFHAVFIRAPLITKTRPGVEILARLEDSIGVAARQRNVLVCAFHPELTDDIRFHQYFLESVAG